MNASALVQVSPSELAVDTNVRTAAGLTKDFCASIKEHGVLVPVVAHRKDDGTLHVLYGQRRTLAAVEAGLDTIPVYVTESLGEADRLAKQVVENDHRRALTDADRIEAFHQLSLLGTSAAAIAKKTGATKATVEAALKVRANDTATAALSNGLTLEQAAVIEEFSAHPELVEKLEKIAAGNPGSFAHTAQRMRDDLARAQAQAEAEAEITAKGLKLADQRVGVLRL